MQHFYCACVVALLSAIMEKALYMWHPEVPEMKAEVVIATFLRFPLRESFHCDFKRKNTSFTRRAAGVPMQKNCSDTESFPGLSNWSVTIPKICGNGGQLQAQKEEIMYLTQRDRKKRHFPHSATRLKSDQNVTL